MRRNEPDHRAPVAIQCPRGLSARPAYDQIFTPRGLLANMATHRRGSFSVSDRLREAWQRFQTCEGGYLH